MNSVKQQHEHNYWKVLIENFSFRWKVQDLEIFLVLSNSLLAAKGLKVAV